MHKPFVTIWLYPLIILLNIAHNTLPSREGNLLRVFKMIKMK